MNRYTIIVLVGYALLLTACAESFPSILDENVQGRPDEVLPQEQDAELTPIMPTLRAPQFNFVTRARLDTEGRPFESWEKDEEHWRDAKFHVFAFQTTNSYGGEVNMNQTQDFQDEGRGSVTMNSLCLLYDRIMHVTDPLSGRVRFVEDKGAYEGAMEDPEKTYFYRINGQNLKYNFFTYYADNAVTSGYRTNADGTQLLCDIAIDGTQDILHAFAFHEREDYNNYVQQLVDQNLPKDYLNVLTTPDSYNQLLYTAAAAHRNINPIFNIRHLLSRFDVNVIGRYTTDNPEERKRNEKDLSDFHNIIITDVSFEVPNKGTFLIADNDWGGWTEGNIGDSYTALLEAGAREEEYGGLIKWNRSQMERLKAIMINDKDVEENKAIYAEIPSADMLGRAQEFWNAETKTFRIKSEEKASLLEQSILLPPSNEITIRLKGFALNYTQVATPKVDDKGNPVTDGNGNPVYTYSKELNPKEPLLSYELESLVKLADPMVFEPGKQYTINIYVYGYQNVYIKALYGSEWKQGEEIPDVNHDGIVDEDGGEKLDG